jgi:hypothetical protein
MTKPTRIAFETAVDTFLDGLSRPDEPLAAVPDAAETVPVAAADFHEVPRALWAPPAGRLPRDAPLDDYLTATDLAYEMGTNSGMIWRWIRWMGKVPYWTQGRAFYVRREDAEPWLDERAAGGKRMLTITKKMVRERLRQLLSDRAPPPPPPLEPAAVVDHPAAPQLPLEVVPSEPGPSPQRGECVMSLHTACMRYDMPFFVLLRACKAKELPSSWIEGRFYVRPRDVEMWFEKHATR